MKDKAMVDSVPNGVGAFWTDRTAGLLVPQDGEGTWTLELVKGFPEDCIKIQVGGSRDDMLAFFRLGLERLERGA